METIGIAAGLLWLLLKLAKAIGEAIEGLEKSAKGYTKFAKFCRKAITKDCNKRKGRKRRKAHQ